MKIFKKREKEERRKEAPDELNEQKFERYKFKRTLSSVKV